MIKEAFDKNSRKNHFLKSILIGGMLGILGIGVILGIFVLFPQAAQAACSPSCSYNQYCDWNTCRNYNCNAYSTRPCSIYNGSGQQTCQSNSSGNTWGSCTLQSCNNGYYASGGYCNANTCNANSSRPCYISNGSGTQSCSLNNFGNSWGTCTVASCQSGYYKSASNSCLQNVCNSGDTRSCTVSNGTGVNYCQVGGGSGNSWQSTCNIVSCNWNYHLEGGWCTANPTPSVSITGTTTVTPMCNEAMSLQLSASGYDFNAGGSATYSWGGFASGNYGPSVNLWLYPSDVGSHSVSVTVTNGYGKSGSASTSVTYSMSKHNLTVEASPSVAGVITSGNMQRGYCGSDVSISVKQNTGYTFKGWTGGALGGHISNAALMSTSFTFGWSDDFIVATFYLPPTAAFKIKKLPADLYQDVNITGTAPLTVYFQDNSFADGTTINSRPWNFGGGSCSSDCSGINPVVAFNSADTYTVSLTVQDSRGAFSGTATKTITVCATGYTWNSTSNTCVADPVSGVCVSKPNSYSAPVLPLCSSGTSTPVVPGTTSWTWTCAGLNNGASPSCSANKIVDAVVSDWTPTSCPTACGSGINNQTRTCTPPVNSGAACPALIQSCPETVACPTASILVGTSAADAIHATTTVSYHDLAYITWSSAYTTSCNVTSSPSAGSWPGLLSHTPPTSIGPFTTPGTTYTYTLTCTGMDGVTKATATATVNVDLPPAGNSTSTVSITRPGVAGLDFKKEDQGNNNWTAGCADIIDCGTAYSPIRVGDKVHMSLGVNYAGGGGSIPPNNITYIWTYKKISSVPVGAPVSIYAPTAGFMDWIIIPETGTYEVSVIATTNINGVSKPFSARLTMTVLALKELIPS